MIDEISRWFSTQKLLKSTDFTEGISHLREALDKVFLPRPSILVDTPQKEGIICPDEHPEEEVSHDIPLQYEKAKWRGFLNLI